MNDYTIAFIILSSAGVISVILAIVIFIMEHRRDRKYCCHNIDEEDNSDKAPEPELVSTVTVTTML